LRKLTLRTASVTDAKLLSELGARTFVETFAVDNTPENMAAYLAAYFNPQQQAAELSDPHTHCTIAELDGLPVGYSVLCSGKAAACVTGDNPIELVRLYVSKDSIGQGVGAALMKECLHYSTSLGHGVIWLGVWERNFRAQQFYLKWDFEKVGTHVFQLGDDAQTDFLMQRTL
jgi:GNAT superfamily N-acetyltransferase